ncbi:hypothetical protein [Pontivivens nitratireducens]|uniref:hypothetical protein n=1 Tax=Pontivivens nitratireducens TaxID=2758038 RepID=UPI001639B507|nr:hypothetical protein [Pontibrevibacter nitratireducens]
MRLVRARRSAKGSGLVSIHAVRIAARIAVFLTTVGLVWGVAQSHPWLTPYVERSARDVALILDAATARNLNAGWVDAQLRLAVTARDRDRVALIVGLAERYDVPLDPALKAQADQVGEISVAQRVIVCGACAYDLNSCPGLADVVSCNLPVELTPLGDVNALRRGAVDWWQDQPVDRFDVALASVGLAATGLAVASGGTSVTVKIGASVLRVGHRLGRVNARLLHAVSQGADSAAGLRGLRVMAGDLADVRQHTSLADTVALLAHVDDVGDAVRLARVAEAAGPATRGHFEVLGKGRVFRALVRLSRPMIALGVLILALLTQISGIIASLLVHHLTRHRRLRGARR